MAGRIRRHDWAATPLGPIVDWPQSLKNAVELMLGSPQFTTIAWGPALTLLYNDACTLLLGTRHPSALGERYTDVWHGQGPDDAIGAALTGRSTRFVDQSFETPFRLDRPSGWFTGSRTPLRDGRGTIVGLYTTGFETTDRILAERAQREREERQAFLLKLSDALRPLPDPAAIREAACRLLGERLGTDTIRYLEADPAEGHAGIAPDDPRLPIPGADRPSAAEWLSALRERNGPVVVDACTGTDPPGPDAAAAWIGIPVLEQGALVGALAVIESTPRRWRGAEVALVRETAERIREAIDRARADQAAREADIRLRTLVDAAPVLIWETDRTGTVFFNEHYKTFFGSAFERMLQSGWKDFVHPDDVEAYAEAYAQAYRERRSFSHAFRALRADGAYRWLRSTGRPFGADRFAGFSTDITDSKRNEERLQRNNAVLQGINRIFGEALSGTSEDALRRVCLEVAVEITGSTSGFMGEIDAQTGRLEDLCFSDRENGAAMPDWATLGGRHLGADDPASDPDRAAAPEAHPPTAFLGVPLKQGETVTGLIGLAHRPGGHRPEDREAAEALAPPIRHALLTKRGESRLHASEARFRQFAQASSDVLWISDAETFATEFASPALSTVFGVAPEAILGDPRRWAVHLVPEDREATFAHLERARGGEAVLHEFRILRPSDGAFRWIRIRGFPLFDEDGRVRRIGGIASDVTEAKQAEQHQAVLLAELQHRVRNIMAVIRSIVERTGEHATSVPEYAALIGGRLLTLARVQSRLTRAADAGVAITVILRDEIGAQAHHEAQFDLSGAEIELPPKAAEVLTLAVHELATNAVKHGALAWREGRVSVRWHAFEMPGSRWLSFDWIESGGPERPVTAPSAPTRRGFGCELIERLVPYELDGRARIELAAGGARCHLEFPLKRDGSILETNAPRRAAVPGGAFDMAGAPDLGGQRILVVEDDFYLANDAARALLQAGAAVLGPHASEPAGLDDLARAEPTGAVVDINLGGEPVFGLARALRARGIPFVFVTGYDEAAIPAEFGDVARLEKPVELRQLVFALAQALRPKPRAHGGD